MLRFITTAMHRRTWSNTISIHLMLRFIKNLMVVVPRKASFQYISCYGLSQNIRDWCHPVRTFQYISCYGLSTTNKHMFIWWNHFNTSHVTVYPRLLALKRNQNSDFNTSHVTVYLVVDNNLPKSRKFQYISCYGLSRDNEWILGRYHVFQYISCYGLSLRICSITGICRHFNTSHVTVYQKLTAQA